MSSEQANEDLNHDSDYQEYYDNFLREDYSAVENIEDVAAGVPCKLLGNLIKQVIDSIGSTEKLYPTLGTCGSNFCIEIYAGDPSKQQQRAHCGLRVCKSCCTFCYKYLVHYC